MTDAEMDDLAMRWSAGLARMERDDPVWSAHAYRMARFLLHLAAHDVRDIAPDGRADADDLIRAVASIGANVAEAHVRASPAERCRFLAAALAAAREAASRYAALHGVVGPPAADARAALLARIRRLIAAMQRTARSRRGAQIRQSWSRHPRVRPLSASQHTP